ncbi:phenylalanine--tRNA ligase subunit beta [Alphaproteobacteria bacterium]|nr:phenylalanine--tRNA ligase subunit beta [Alphaproteobacteria bacterium]MDC1241170.1 phenylalanine--tRNA ligase subunit beta [bacterium]
MKFTLSWLQEHLDTSATLEVIVETLTLVGLEVEELVDPAARLAGFEVAEIIATEPHPDADKLQICTVQSGEGTQKLVCGAPNARSGLRGILAKQGAVIPSNGMVLAKAKIRGVESNGMMCSAAELQLSDDHDGIIELDASFDIGASAASALGQTDPMIEIAITPNRPDCLGVRGIARDLAAAGLGTLKADPTQAPKAGGQATPNIEVSGPVCAAFGAILISGVTNAPSPAWLQQRLRAIGLNPISALVDITNYISYDRGRPLHVYDADRLTGGVRARQAKAGESLVALDEKTYELTPDDCVIADDAGVLGLAGIMGGLASGSTNETVNVLVESAWFEPIAIALSGRHHYIESDARYRFERGVDRNSVTAGLDLAVQMIVDICGGTPHEAQTAGALIGDAQQLDFDPAKVASLTGLQLDEKDMQRILEDLGFGVETGATWKIHVPSWRPDIEGQADIVEEVTRIYGLDKVPAQALPMRHDVTRPTLTVEQRRVHIMRRALAGRGLVEAVTWSFISGPDATLFGVADGLELANPISADLSHMRPSLLPGLLAAAARNVDRGFGDVALFEVGQEFLAPTPGAQRLAASGIRRGHSAPRRWQGAPQLVDGFEARADAEAALAACGVDASSLQVLPPQSPWYHPGRSGILARNPKQPMAAFGEVHPAVLKHFGLSGPLVAFEVWPQTVPEGKKQKGQARPALDLSNLQPVRRDFAFEVKQDVAADRLVRAARGADKKLISEVRVFDVFQGGGLAEDAKSIALEVTLQPVEATLTDADIEAVVAKITAAVEKAGGGKLRG